MQDPKSTEKQDADPKINHSGSKARVMSTKGFVENYFLCFNLDFLPGDGDSKRVQVGGRLPRGHG